MPDDVFVLTSETSNEGGYVREVRTTLESAQQAAQRDLDNEHIHGGWSRQLTWRSVAPHMWQADISTTGITYYQIERFEVQP